MPYGVTNGATMCTAPIDHDFRRTGAVEAITGGAKAEQVAHAMGNMLSASNALFATYVPVNVATLREVMAAQRAGPNIIAEHYSPRETGSVTISPSRHSIIAVVLLGEVAATAA
jgi:hypothetical protein